MSARIFLSYRRQDSSGHAGRIFDRLNAAFGANAVFHDVDSIHPGQDFIRVIEDTVGACSTALVMIGPDWLEIADSTGRRRLEDENDVVLLEVASALRRGIPVIPVLVGGARMPGVADLPDDLRPLARLNAIEVRHSHFEGDIQKLLDVLETTTSLKAKSPSAMSGLKRRVRESPIFVAQIAVCLAAGGLSYWWPPPADLTAAGSSAAAPLAVIVLLAAVLVLVVLQTRLAAGASRRLMVAALVCLSGAAGAALVVQTLWSDFTTVYDSRTVVVGSELTPNARKYLEDIPGMRIEDLVFDASGKVEQLWTRASIRRNVYKLRVAHVALMVCFAGCVLVFLQLIRGRP